MNPNNFSINLCEEKNIGLVMDFIGKEWAKGHILSKDMELMSWQYGANTNFYNWFLGTNGSSISGILGFIPISKFDSFLVNHDFIWLALWKVRDGKKTQGLGLRLLRELLSKRPASGFGVLGINPDHLKLYKSLGFEVGQLIQSYIVNPNSKQTLILNPKNEILPRAKSGNAILKLIQKKDLRNISLKSDEIIPLQGPNFKSILKYKEMVNVPLIASGGVSSIEDIKKLYSFKVHGVIVGKAIYDNKVKINEIFNIN